MVEKYVHPPKDFVLYFSTKLHELLTQLSRLGTRQRALGGSTQAG